MIVIRSALAVSFLAAASAFSLAPRPGITPALCSGGVGRSFYRSPMRVGSRALLMTGAADVPEVEYVKIFGRLGEKYIFGDGSAGACCHSGCDNCEWRYTFDVLQAARPKWIPTYDLKTFDDGREHAAKWAAMFEENEKLTKEAFLEKLAELKFDMPLGPTGFLTAKQADYSEDAGNAVWEHLSRGKDTLSAKQMKIRLRKMAPGEEGVMWGDFYKATTDTSQPLQFTVPASLPLC